MSPKNGQPVSRKTLLTDLKTLCAGVTARVEGLDACNLLYEADLERLVRVKPLLVKAHRLLADAVNKPQKNA